jgi:hypothetical protein
MRFASVSKEITKTTATLNFRDMQNVYDTIKYFALNILLMGRVTIKLLKPI